MWQLQCQQRQTNRIKLSANSSELTNFSSLSFWEKPHWNTNLLLLTTTARHFFYTLVRLFPTLSCFPIFHKLYNFPNTFNWYLTTHMSTNDNHKMVGLFIYNFLNYQTILPHPSKRNDFGIKSCSYKWQNPAFVLNTSKSCFNFELFLHKFFVKLILATKIKTMLLKQSAVKKILCIS